MARIDIKAVISNTIPSDLHHLGHKGLAGAVMYLCCYDIAHETYSRLEKGDNAKESENCQSAKKFLRRKDNPLYLLEIPGEELIEIIERTAKEKYERRHRKNVQHCGDVPPVVDRGKGEEQVAQ